MDRADRQTDPQPKRQENDGLNYNTVINNYIFFSEFCLQTDTCRAAAQT